MRAWIPIALAAAAVTTSGAGGAKDAPAMALSSTEFKDGAPLPASASCDGEAMSPQLSWKSRQEAKSYALIVDDPDAPKGTFTHWVLFDIPRNTTTIQHGGTAGTVGTNSGDKVGFYPACPPKGSGLHHYRFHLYALDRDKLGAPAGAMRDDVEKAMKDHVVGESTLTGTYERR